jgi:ABC-2 type transport system ATP-binding protein
MNDIVTAHQLSFSYRNTTVIKKIDLTIREGSIFGFVGPNGAGKSTTIKLLLGLLKPQSGSITIFGKEITGSRVEILRQIGSMVETPSLYPHLTGGENIEVIRRIMDIPRSAIDHVLSLSGILDAKDKKVKEYSLGMKQRLGIALSLLHSPKLLILDEPINGLDPEGIREFRMLLQQLTAGEGITVLLSSHILSELEQVITSVGIISAGEMKFLGSLEELKKLQRGKLIIEVSDPKKSVDILRRQSISVLQAESGRLTIESGGRDAIASINSLLVQNNIGIYELKFDQPNLESVFLSLIREGNGQ